MKKLALSLAIVSALGLTACDSETIQDVKDDVADNGPVVQPIARVIFDPTNGALSVPNDLLFLGTQDGTLNPPVDDPTDGGDPFVALSGLDGWSTTNPWVLDIAFPDNVSLDGNSVFNPSSVRIFEAIMGGDLNDPECNPAPQGTACKIVGELAYTTDFITQKSGNSVAVIPLKPLKPKTTYLLVMTNNLLDSNGNSVEPSATYELVRQDINTHPLGSASQLALQGLVNSFEAAVVGAGVEKDTIIQTSAITTQSTVDVSMTLKSLHAANVPQIIEAAMAGQPMIGLQDTGMSVADVLTGQIPPELAPLYASGNFLAGKISLPYYSGVPTQDNPMAPVNEWWTSMCDSAAVLAAVAAQDPSLIPSEPTSATDGACMQIAAAAGIPAPGLRDLRNPETGEPLFDKERNLTKFSPVAAPTMPMMEIDVQMTTPDLAAANVFRGALGLPDLVKPAEGWPIVIMQHGITSRKEDMLAITGLMSAYGLATIAIDHPLHGSRGFDLNGDGIDEINASTVSATHYMNLASLLTTRDNLRQSTADLVGLRLGVNFMGAVDPMGQPMALDIDTSKVHFLGHSLGAIAGINFVAIANTPLGVPDFDAIMKVSTNSQAMPGVMAANFLLESPAFGNTIKSSLTYAQVPEFKQLVDTMYPDGATEEELEEAYVAFYNSLDPAGQGQLNGLFAQFAFAAQTVTDSGDPANYAPMLAATMTPTHLIEVVGNGADNLPDQVIPNTVSVAPFGGTEGAIALQGLPSITEMVQSEDGVSGAVRFTWGHHGSILTPAPTEGAMNPEMNARSTQEMQNQVVNFFSSNGQVITVQDSGVIKQ